MASSAKQLTRKLRKIGHAAEVSVLRVLGRTRKTEALQSCEVASYAELLCQPKPAMLTLYGPKPMPPTDELLFPELASDEIRADHYGIAPSSTGVGLTCVSDVLVSGRSLVGTSSCIYELGNVVPAYVDSVLRKDPFGYDPPVGRRSLTRRSMRFMPGVSVLVTHWNSDVYGHWLLECMPKLLLLQRIQNELPVVRILLPVSISPWIISWITFVLPNVAIEYFNPQKEYLRCEKLLLPSALMESVHYFHPELDSLIDGLCRQLAREVPKKTLYVTRMTQSYYRELSNRQEIEAIALSEGMTVVCPELLSIPEQIALFANARLVVGEFGSAMHNTLFSPPATKVLSLNWINGLQSRLAHLRKQQIGYLLPSDGVPVKYTASESKTWYHIDPQTFRRCVRTLLAVEH